MQINKYFNAVALKPALACAALFAAGIAGAIDQFWLADARSGDVTGPVVFVPGTKFRIGGATFTALAAGKGEILFADAASSRQFGPYGFVENRIIYLAEKPYFFSKIERYTGSNPEGVKAVTSRQGAAPAEAAPDRSRPPEAPAAPPPARWDPAPLRSTNPADHREFTDISVTEHARPFSIAAWVEPISKTKYDWSIGGFAGNAGENLESDKFGFSAGWRRWSFEAGLVNASKISGTIVPDKTYVTSLKLENGSGWAVSGGYAFEFEVDDRWSAAFGVRAAWRSVSYDLTGVFLTRHNQPAAAEEGGAGEGGEPTSVLTYDKHSEQADMTELSASLTAAMSYDGGSWGVDLLLMLDAWIDTEVDGTLRIVDEEYALQADKSHPIEACVSAWKGIAEGFSIFSALSFGSQNRLRIGIQKQF